MPSSSSQGQVGGVIKASGGMGSNRGVQAKSRLSNNDGTVKDDEDESGDSSDDDNLHEEPPDMRVYPEFLKNLPGVQASDSMGYRIEALRVYLET